MTHVPDPDPWRDDILAAISDLIQKASKARNAEMIAHIDRRYDGLANRITELESEVASLRRQGGDARRQNNLADLLARQAQAMLGNPTDLPLPEPGTPVPIAIEEACAADPAEGAQRVDLTEYGIVAFPRPGADPRQVWRDIEATAVAEGRLHGLRRPRRAR